MKHGGNRLSSELMQEEISQLVLYASSSPPPFKITMNLGNLGRPREVGVGGVSVMSLQETSSLSLFRSLISAEVD